MKVPLTLLARTAMLGAVATTASLALAAAPLPAVHDEGGVAYLSGGIGQRESRAIEDAEKHWPLTLEFAQREHGHGDFVADVAVVVRGTGGRPSLKATSDGPFLLAKLPPGRYTVDATLDGKVLHHAVTVRRGVPTRALLVWPAGTDNG